MDGRLEIIFWDELLAAHTAVLQNPALAPAT
jgi:hypothetical protein